MLFNDFNWPDTLKVPLLMGTSTPHVIHALEWIHSTQHQLGKGSTIFVQLTAESPHTL